MRLLLFPLLAWTTIAPAQQIVTVGVKAGIPLTEALPHSYDFGDVLDTGRWTVGPTIELRLIRGFSVEVDALYRTWRLSTTAAFPAVVDESGNQMPAVAYTNYQETNVWEIPLLLKYRFSAGRLRPFVTGGATFTHESADITTLGTCLGLADQCNNAQNPDLGHLIQRDPSRWRKAPTGGLGLEFKYGRFSISPEVRYSRYNHPNTHQVSVLVGFTF